MALSAVQKTVVEAYDGGELVDTVKSEADAATCGDSLLKFLLIELSEHEDCADYETAIQRVETAGRQLEEVANALYRAAAADLPVAVEAECETG